MSDPPKPAKYGKLAPRTTLHVSEGTAKSMRGNKSKNTNLELLVRKALWKAGVRGYRLHRRIGSARPDLYFPRHRLAVFIHGCFWHGCPHCDKRAALKSNAAYWNSKIDQNITRFTAQQAELESLGIRVHVIWECEAREELESLVQNLAAELRMSP
jgi:DNA mismatch endonuclease, patch repair protein